MDKIDKMDKMTLSPEGHLSRAAHLSGCGAALSPAGHLSGCGAALSRAAHLSVE
jgi:hypothetical protein